VTPLTATATPPLWGQFARNSRNTPTVLNAPAGGKLEWLGYHMLNNAVSIQYRNVTDRRTDRIVISISRASIARIGQQCLNWMGITLPSRHARTLSNYYESWVVTCNKDGYVTSPSTKQYIGLRVDRHWSCSLPVCLANVAPHASKERKGTARADR